MAVYRRGKKWRAAVDLPKGADGERRQTCRVFNTRREAEDWEAKVRSQVAGGEYADPGRLTVGEYLNQWLDAVSPSLKPNTVANYGVVSGRWRKALGNVLLRNLTPLAIQRTVNDMAATLAPVTTRTSYSVLRTALRQAVQWGILSKSPAAGVKVPGSEAEMSCWNEAEAARFVRAVQGATRYAPLFRLALASGMRLGELLGLRWDDVDLEQGVVSVTHSLSWPRGGEPELVSPKTARSRRRISIDPGTVAALRHHRAQQSAQRLAKGPAWPDLNLVFCTRRGGYVRQEIVERALHVLETASDLPRIRFHDLRHTHATILLRQGRIIKEVSDRLGHANIAITLQRYSHVLPDQQAEMARVMGHVLDVGGDPR